MEYVVRVSGSQKLTPKIMNMNGDDDPFNRYKMRQLYVQVVGKGKMIKTIFLNLDDVSHDLKVPPSFVTAYMGYEIGTPSKQPDRDRPGSISGEYDSMYLSGVLRKMIHEFIMCPNCHQPECVVAVHQKSKKITLECGGCRASSVPVLKEKFQKFILNNEGQLKEIKTTTSAAKALAAKRSPKEKEKEKEGDEDEDGLGNGKEREKKNAKSNGAGDNSGEGEDEEDWATSTSEEAIRERQLKLLPDRLKSLVLDPSTKKAAKVELSPLDALRAHFAEFGATHTPQEVLEEIKRLQKERNFDATHKVHCFFASLQTGKDFPTHLNENKEVLKEIIQGEELQSTFLDLLEDLDGDEALSKKIPTLLHTLYDDELLEEEVILKWGSGKHRTQFGAILRKNATPFIEWLQNAEEESGDE